MFIGNVQTGYTQNDAADQVRLLTPRLRRGIFFVTVSSHSIAPGAAFQPLPGSIATASTLAFALVHKYVDGTPLYRLAQTFERAGVPVSRGALGHWVIGSSEKHLARIYDALKLRLRSQPLIHGDETTVQVLKEKDKQATRTSFMWAYRSGEDSDEPIVLLDYQPGRGQIYPQAFLGDSDHQLGVEKPVGAFRV